MIPLSHPSKCNLFISQICVLIRIIYYQHLCALKLIHNHRLINFFETN